MSFIKTVIFIVLALVIAMVLIFITIISDKKDILIANTAYESFRIKRELINLVDNNLWLTTEYRPLLNYLVSTLSRFEVYNREIYNLDEFDSPKYSKEVKNDEYIKQIKVSINKLQRDVEKKKHKKYLDQMNELVRHSQEIFVISERLFESKHPIKYTSRKIRENSQESIGSINLMLEVLKEVLNNNYDNQRILGSDRTLKGQIMNISKSDIDELITVNY